MMVFQNGWGLLNRTSQREQERLITKRIRDKLDNIYIIIKYNKMENYKEFYVTGFNKLMETIKEIENDPRVEDYDEYCEERHDDQENNVYYLQVVYK